MVKKFLSGACVIAMVMGFVACSDDDDNNVARINENQIYNCMLTANVSVKLTNPTSEDGETRMIKAKMSHSNLYPIKVRVTDNGVDSVRFSVSQLVGSMNFEVSYTNGEGETKTPNVSIPFYTVGSFSLPVTVLDNETVYFQGSPVNIQNFGTFNTLKTILAAVANVIKRSQKGDSGAEEDTTSFGRIIDYLSGNEVWQLNLVSNLVMEAEAVVNNEALEIRMDNKFNIGNVVNVTANIKCEGIYAGEEAVEVEEEGTEAKQGWKLNFDWLKNIFNRNKDKEEK